MMHPAPRPSTGETRTRDGAMTPQDTLALDKRVTLKLDLILLPFLCLFFLVNSLDRSNIGNAETARFTRDAGLQPDDLNTAVALFFAFFVALQPVGAACGRRFGMRLWVPSVMLVWGVCTAAHVWVTRRWQLIVLRCAIGVLESGFYPTTVAYLSLFYTRFEFGRRLGVFYGQYAVAGALGGLLSYLVFSRFPAGDDDNDAGAAAGWKSWQVLFLLEGALTVVIAIVGFFWLPDTADRAWFLSKREREWARDRVWLDRQQTQSSSASAAGGRASPNLSPAHEHENNDADGGSSILQHDTAAESAEGEDAHLLPRSTTDGAAAHPKTPPGSAPYTTRFSRASGLTRQDIVSAFLDGKVFYLLALNILSAIPAAAFGVFLPLVVQGLGFAKSPSTTNLLTVPPFLAGAAVLYLFVWWSDATHQRLKPILWGLAILLLGLALTVLLPHAAPLPRYAALCILLAGSFVASPLTIAWLSGNIEEPGKRSVVLGINGWGNVAGVVSSLLFSKRFAPGYALPFFVTLVCVLVAFVGYVAFRWWLQRINAWRAAVVGAWDPDEVDAERKWGRGPVDTVPGWRRSLQKVLVGGREDDSGEDSASRRRGEDKLTFTYGL